MDALSKNKPSSDGKSNCNSGSQPALFCRESAHRGVVRLTIFTVIYNIGLVLVKAITGIVAGSAALISDAAMSTSDVLYGIGVIIGVRLSGRKADEKHPYGYERFESLTTLFLGIAILVTGLLIGYDGALRVWQGLNYEIEAPTTLALWVAAGLVACKVFMHFFTKARAKKYRSDVLTAMAADHGTDALATSGVFVAIAAAQLGFPIMDPIASIVIAGFIVKTGISIIRMAVWKITDRSADPEVEGKIRNIIAGHDEILNTDKVLTRIFGDRIYVDVEIRLPGNYSLHDAHEVGVRIHNEVEEQIPDVKHCTVHINPCGIKHCEVNPCEGGFRGTSPLRVEKD